MYGGGWAVALSPCGVGAGEPSYNVVRFGLGSVFWSRESVLSRARMRVGGGGRLIWVGGLPVRAWLTVAIIPSSKPGRPS